MGAVTIGFLVLGGLGAALLALALVFGEVLNLEHSASDGPFSVPAIAGFIGALGFMGAIGAEYVGGDGSGALTVGGAVGLASALPVGWLALRITRALSGMNTDGTVTASALVGTQGVVVTRVPAGGYGEVRLMISGQPLKVNAKADEPIAAGASVFVVGAPTETSVVVVETTTLP
jgi:membrane-bound ClpP family serine protease